MRRMNGWRMVVAVAIVAGIGRQATAEKADGPRGTIEKASVAYAEAFNRRDYEALADQWTAGAVLVEGGSRVAGRDAIVRSIRGWLEKHPKASMRIDVTGVEMIAESLARVAGTIVFTRSTGETPVMSPFTSLRVVDDGAWRLAESVVSPNHAAALDDLGWLLGSWQAHDPQSGMTMSATYEKAAGGRVILGRIRIEQKDGRPVEAIEVIHADRAAGVIHVAVNDSTGAHAEGVIESDGTTLNRSLVGSPGDGADGGRAQWVQSIVPGGDGRFTMQSIERSLDGRPLPDGQPMHFTRKK
ncbi:MAG: YybH family protein [Planctomycetia bacterium]